MSHKRPEGLITSPTNKFDYSISRLFNKIDNSCDKTLPDDNFFWFSRLSEFSFSDFIWQDYIKLNAHVSGYSNDSSKIKSYFLSFLNRFGYNLFSFTTKKSSILSLFCLFLCSAFILKYPLRYLSNLINELIGHLLIRINVPSRPVNCSCVFYCDYPSNWNVTNSSYRFTGDINFAELNPTPFYLISLYNSFDAFIQNPIRLNKNINQLNKSGVPFIALQHYSSLKTIFLAYIQGFSNSHIRSIVHSCNSLKMKRYFFNILFRSIFIDYPKQNSIFLSSYNFFKSSRNIRSLFLPVFELTESRAVVRGAKSSSTKINVTGIQHGSIGRWASIRYCAVTTYLYRNHRSFIPDYFLQEGELTNTMFQKRGLPTKIVGAVRLRGVHKYTNTNEISTVCLVLLDLHFWKYLLDSLFAYSSICHDIQFIVRAHPKSLSSVSTYLRNKAVPQNIIFDTTSDLSSLLHTVSPRAVIAGPTGGLLDFALSSYPCFLFSSIKSFEMNPLSFNSERIIRIYDDLTSWSSFNARFYNISDDYIKYITSDAVKHINCYGTASDKLLTQMIKSDT